MKKVIVYLVALVLVLTAFAGCTMKAPVKSEAPAQSEAPAATAAPTAIQATEAPKEEIIIGYTPLSMEMEYFNVVAKQMEKKAAELGMKLIVKDPQMDAGKQVTGIEEMIAAGAKVIAICSIDPAAAEAAAKMCAEKGVKVISHVSTFKGADMYVGLDEYQFGFKLGEGLGKYIKEKLNGKANVAVFDADSLGEGLLQRSKGMVEGITSVAPDAKFVARTTAFTEEKAMNDMETMLLEHPDINVVITCNDPGAYGAISAIEAKGLGGKVAVGCIGGDLRVCEYVLNGKLLLAHDQGAAFTGATMAEVAKQLLDGSAVEKNLIVKTELITADNSKDFFDKRKADIGK